MSPSDYVYTVLIALCSVFVCYESVCDFKTGFIVPYVVLALDLLVVVDYYVCCSGSVVCLAVILEPVCNLFAVFIEVKLAVFFYEAFLNLGFGSGFGCGFGSGFGFLCRRNCKKLPL